MTHDYPLTPEEFKEIYDKVPRLTVEILLTDQKGLYLTKRSIEPCKGQWHLPGGTVYFGEHLLDAVKRIAHKELGINVETAKPVGFVEYPSHFLRGIDHPFGVAFEVTDFTGQIALNNEATAGDWFKQVPEPMHADQDTFLKSHGYLQ